jgi:hypothetical protein
MDSVSQDLQDVEAAYQSLLQQDKHSEDQVKRLTSQLQNCEVLESELEDERKRSLELMQENEKLFRTQQELLAIHNDEKKQSSLITALEDKVDSQIKEITRLHQVVKEKDSLCESFKNTKASSQLTIEKAIESIQALQQDNDHLYKTIEKLTSQALIMRGDNDQLQTSIDNQRIEMEKHRKQIDLMRQQHQALAQANTEIKLTSAHFLFTCYEKMNSWRDQLADQFDAKATMSYLSMQSQAEILEALDLKDYNGLNSGFSSIIDDLDSLFGLLNNLRGSIVHSTNQILASFAQQFSYSNDKLEALRLRVHDYQQQVSMFKGALSRSQQYEQTLREEIAKLEVKLADGRRHFDMERERHHKLVDDSGSLQKSYEKVLSDYNVLKDSLTNSISKRSLDEERQAIETSSYMNNINQMSRQIDNLERANEQQHQQLISYQQELKDLSSEKIVLLEKLKQLRPTNQITSSPSHPLTPRLYDDEDDPQSRFLNHCSNLVNKSSALLVQFESLLLMQPSSNAAIIMKREFEAGLKNLLESNHLLTMDLKRFSAHDINSNGSRCPRMIASNCSSSTRPLEHKDLTSPSATKSAATTNAQDINSLNLMIDSSAAEAEAKLSSSGHHDRSPIDQSLQRLLESSTSISPVAGSARFSKITSDLMDLAKKLDALDHYTFDSSSKSRK